MNWHDYFYYENGFLIWKERDVSTFKTKRSAATWNTRFAHKTAGNKCPRFGYVMVRIGRGLYRAHRIIWEMHNGQIQGDMQIDHINHVRHDNRIENLRLVNNLGNGMNQSIATNNSSGVTGVTWNSDRKKWMAQIKVKGKNIYLGLFVDFNNAAKAREEAEVKHGFHQNHGRRTN